MGSMTKGKFKDRQNKSFHTQKNYKHFQGGYGGLQFGYVYACNGILKKCASFKKLSLEHFFTSLLSDLSMED